MAGNNKRHNVVAWRLISAMLLATVVPPLYAQTTDYPSRPIRMIVGYTPGGASDIMARTLAKSLTQELGQSVLVENRPGAASNIAADFVAKAPGDGYTLLLGTIALSINPSLYKKLSYDPLKDLAPVSEVASTPFLLVSTASSGIKSVADLIRIAKAATNPLDYASAGNGSGANLFMEYFKSAAGIQLVHIPYAGTSPAMTDMLGGRVPLTFDNIVTTLPLVKQGKFIGLAVSTKTRAAVAPDIPTLQEAGIRGYEATAWFGLFVPAKTPAAIIQKLNAATVHGMKDPGVRKTLLEMGSEPATSTPAEFGAFYRNEIQKWARVVHDAGLQTN
jgi:tripartite-type tricarboxylate transporter receptor subunit TctC